MAINYDDFIIHTKKSGQKIKKFKCSCDTCGVDRGFLPKAKAFTVCLSCKRQQPDYKERHRQAILAVRSTEESRLKTVQQMNDLWGNQRVDATYLLNNKIKNNLRSRLSHAIRGHEKWGSAVADIGCSLEELKKHLESRFQLGMTWDNYGINGWEIDHVEPLIKYDLTDRKQLLLACHYTNLQPLWVGQNRSKGGKYA